MQADSQGLRGIGNRLYPNQHATRYLIEAPARTQHMRERLLRQLNFLSAQGFFRESETTLETDAGARPAREYLLTWQGFAALGLSDTLCFAAGRRQFDGIEKIAKAKGQTFGQEVWEITFRTRVEDVPSWARAAEVQTLFPEYAKALVQQPQKMHLLRGPERWLSEPEMQLETQAALLRAAGRDAAGYLAQMAQRFVSLPPAPPTTEAAKALFDDYVGSSQWQQRSMAACLPLHLLRGGDERPTPGAPTDLATFSATWMDAPVNVRGYGGPQMLTQLHILSALEAAGLATVQTVGRGIVNNQPVATGVKYVLKPDFIGALGVGMNGGCMAFGRIGELEFLGSTFISGNARIAARGRITMVQPWARELAEHLPALKTLLEDGLPFTGQLQFSADQTRPGGEEPKWRLTSLTAHYPGIHYSSVPAALQVYLPATSQAATTPIKGPAESPTLPLGLPPVAAQPQTQSTARATLPSTITQAAPVAPSRKAPYDVGAADLHVVSVYKGQVPFGKETASGQPIEGTVEVIVGRMPRPVVLFLNAYDPVHWRVRVDGGTLQRVFAIGYHDQRVSLEGARGVPVLTGNSIEFFSKAGVDPRDSFPYEALGNHGVTAAEMTTAAFAKVPATFQGPSHLGETRFRINTSSPAFLPPGTRSVGSIGAGKVGLIAGSKSDIRDLWVTSNWAWATRAYNAGKVYFEATLSVESGGAAQPPANVGIGELAPRGGIDVFGHGSTPAIANGEQRLYKDGDVFGIAIDYDVGMMYTRVNGEWITGPPDIGKGRSFRVGRERAPFLRTASIDRGAGKRAAISWQANFGATPFRHPLPNGYSSYDGSQR